MNMLTQTTPDFLPEFIHAKPVETESEQRFAIDTEEKAAWAAQKLLRSQHRIQLRIELAERYRDRINQWLSEANKPDEDTHQTMSALLHEFLSRHLEPRSKTRSLKLLGATIGLRKRPDRIEFYDPEQAMNYCQELAPDAIQIKKELSKSVLKTMISQGETIPGVTLVEGEDELSVKGA